MNILVTGSAGFIGKYLVKKLKEENHSIGVIDLIEGIDIFSAETPDLISQADVVYHLAALTNVQESFKYKDRYFETNIMGTEKIAKYCDYYEKKLIYPSSAAVYDENSSPYAASKALAEEAIKKYCIDCPFTILRLFNIYGLEPRFETMLGNFATKSEIRINGDGEQTRDFIRVEDVVSIMVDAIKDEYNDYIFDVGMGKPYSVNKIAELFSNYRKVPIVHKPTVSEVRNSVANTVIMNKLYKKLFCTNLEYDISQMCIKV